MQMVIRRYRDKDNKQTTHRSEKLTMDILQKKKHENPNKTSYLSFFFFPSRDPMSFSRETQNPGIDMKNAVT